MVLEEVQLKHQLTDFEMAALARSQSQAFGKLKALEDEIAAIKKDYAGRLALSNAEISSIASRVNTGFEMRNIRCLLLDERPDGYRLVVRTDNGHVARRRKLNPEERQIKLSADEPRVFTHQATLPVDDESWEADVTQVLLYEDEYEELKAVPLIEVSEWTPRRALPEPKQKGKK